MGFLRRILDIKRRGLRKDKEYVIDLERKIADRYDTRDFVGPLKSEGVNIIAEIKRASPSAGHIKTVDPKEQAWIYETSGARAVSVLTEEEIFKGSLEDLEDVSSAVNVPVLRKDFIIDRTQILEARAFGADAVLLIVRMLTPRDLAEMISLSEQLGMTPFVEVFTLEEADLAMGAGARVIGINNRDLDTLELHPNLSIELAPEIRNLGAEVIVAESGIESRGQILRNIEAGVDAFLIGTSIMRSDDPGGKLKELIGTI